MKNLVTLLALLFSSFIYSQSITDSLLLYYPFNGNAMDASGNGFDGNSNASLTSDRFGNPNSAFSFNGINQFIDLPNLNELKPELPVSFSFWVKYNSLSNEDQVVFNTSFKEDISSGVSFNSSASTGGYAVNFGDGSPYFTSSSRRTFVSNTSIDINKWHHVAVVINSATDMKIYINCRNTGGNHSGSGGGLSYSNTPGTLGRHDQNTGSISAFHFNGYLDDFRYWNRALTMENIIWLCSEEPLSTDDFTSESFKISVYPNPVKDVLNIKFNENSKIENIVLYDALGQIVYQGKYHPQIRVDFLKTGFYVLHLIDLNKNPLGMLKIMKE